MIEIPDEFFKSKWWKDTFKSKCLSSAEAYFDLVSKCCMSETRISYRYLSERWGWATTNVYRFLNNLSQQNLISFSTDKKDGIINIGVPNGTKVEHQMEHQNPDKHWGFSDIDGTPNGTQSGTQEKKKENEKKNPPHPLKEKKNKKEKNERDLPAHAHTHEGEILIDPEEYELSFENFWRLYDKKVGKPNCEKKWNALSKSDRRAAIEYIPLYIAAQPDKQFRKNPQTFLNQKSWNDEIINRTYKPTAAENIAAAQEQCIRDCADMLAGRRYETVQDNLPF